MKKINFIYRKAVHNVLVVSLVMFGCTLYPADRVGALVLTGGVKMADKYYVYSGRNGMVEVSALYWWSSYIIQGVVFLIFFIFSMCLIYNMLCDKMNNKNKN